MPAPIVISGVGMVSAAGRDAAVSCAAIRARLVRFRELEGYYHCRGEREGDERPAAVLAPALEERPADPMAALTLLMVGALRDLIAGARLQRADLSALRFSVILPPWAAAVRPGFLESVAARAGISGIEPAAAAVGGHAAMLTAVPAACAGLTAGSARGWVIAGVGSYFHGDVLAALDDAGRLKSARNRDGFIPGECAAAILLEPQAACERRGARPLAIVRGAGTGHEPQPIGTGDPATGQGLHQAIEQALSAAQVPGGVSWVACDLNGESYRAREWGLVRARLPARLGAIGPIWHPADSIGDVGAASGGVLMTAVTRAFVRRYQPAARALVWAGSDDGLRSALVLDNPGDGGT